MKKRDDIFFREIEARIEKISSHLKRISHERFMKSDLHRSAIVRELEVIGEAANKVSPETRDQFKNLPWNQMIAMRNRLIHGYFDVDYSIVWEVAKNETPKLLGPVREAILITSPPLHPWRVCPSGFYHVRRHDRTVRESGEHPQGETTVRQHCRRNPSGKDQLYSKEILEIAETAKRDAGKLGTIGKLIEPQANDFDDDILVWTKYWNDVIVPTVPLDPNVVKALLGSESAFGKNKKNGRVSKGNLARGPFQITDQARKALSNESGELKDHYVTLSAKDVLIPALAASGAIRWLFQKQKLASNYLKRNANWEETVAEYKSYLRGKKNYKTATGMKNFYNYLKLLQEKK